MKSTILISLITCLIGGVILSCVTGPKEAGINPIFKNDETGRMFEAEYDRRLEAWPVVQTVHIIPTKWGSAHVIECGNPDGETVVMFHAMYMTSLMWEDQVDLLADDYHIYLVDYIGEFGRSRLADVEVCPQTAEEAMIWINSVFEALAIDKAHIFGASFGGWLAQQFALAYPDKAETLTLFAPMGITTFPEEAGAKIGSVYGDPTEEKFRDLVYWSIGEDQHVLDFCEDFLYLGFTNGNKVLGFGALSPGELAAIDIPVLLVFGTKDPLVGDAATAVSNAAALPNARIEVLESSHMVSIERTAEVNALIKDFLP